MESAVEGSAETVNGFIVAAIEERLGRREGGSTASAVRAKTGSTTGRTARSREPRSAPPVILREPARPAHSPTCKCGTCKPKTTKPEEGKR